MENPAAALSNRLQFYLLKGMNKAIRDYQMIADGDRTAVAVSGGKDSLTLLRLLWARRQLRPDKYELIAIHVVSDAESCGGPVDRAALLEHLQGYGIEYALPELPVPIGQPARPNQSPCFHCAWRRRKAIFETAARLGCNKVAFGHHADDLAETTLLNLFFQGRVETMEPRRAFFGGKLTVIRPLAYIEEKEIVHLARNASFPPPPPPCPGADRSQRELMHQIIAQVRAVEPRIKINLFRAAARPLLRNEEHRSEADEGEEE
jgi:tRNA 2-thiocytidine biosynthesis protein TtcA